MEKRRLETILTKYWRYVLSPRKNKKMKKRLFNISLLLASIIIILYVLYRVISLITVPTNSVIIEEGIITSEESATRVCY